MIILVFEKINMLLFDPLYDAIVQSLVDPKWSSIQELHTDVMKKHQISLPNFYKVVGHLIDEQIIIKENGKLSLHNRWVLGMLDLANQLKGGYLSDMSSIALLQEWQVMYHEANSIEALDWVRGDRMLQTNRMYGKQESTYVYQARPYYALGMNRTEMSFFAQANKLADVYFLTGNTKFLDIYWVNCYKNIWIKALATDNLPLLKDGYCVTVVGDFVFEVLYPKEISDYFKIFFDSITDIKDFNPNLFHRIFEMKANCKLTVRHDAIQAKNIKNEFKKAFS